MLDEMGGEAETEEAEPLDELEAEEPVEDEAIGGSFDSFADLALDSTLPMAERRAALKEAIMSCMGTDYAEESAPGAESSLAAIFGG
jgi:hypothetical protein